MNTTLDNINLEKTTEENINIEKTIDSELTKEVEVTKELQSKTIEEKLEDLEVAETLDDVVQDTVQVVDKTTGTKKKIKRFSFGNGFELKIKHHKGYYLLALIIFVISLVSLFFEIYRFNQDMQVWAALTMALISVASVVLSFMSVFLWRIFIKFKHKELFKGLILVGNRISVWDGEKQIEQGYLFKAKLTWYLKLKVKIEAYGYKENDILVRNLEIDIPKNKLNIWYRYYETPESEPERQFLTIDIPNLKVEFFKKII